MAAAAVFKLEKSGLILLLFRSLSVTVVTHGSGQRCGGKIRLNLFIYVAWLR